MSEPTNGFFRSNLGLILLIIGLGIYILVAGTTGSCPACSVITSAAGIGGNSDAPAPDGVEIPPWSLVSLEGEQFTSTDLLGKVIILDFWATWCPPCHMVIPSFIELQEEYRDKGLVVIGIALDDGGPRTVRTFAEKNGINYPLAMGNREILQAAGGVEALPTTLIIDKEGRVVERHVGYAPKATFEKTIKSIL